jgi:hypothetical protein
VGSKPGRFNTQSAHAIVALETEGRADTTVALDGGRDDWGSESEVRAVGTTGGEVRKGDQW